MKLKELHIRNIASIVEADIDFEKGLNEYGTNTPASTFLISGDTGVGKTTILDAITLALYKTTPRIEGVGNKRENQFGDGNGQMLNVFDIKQYTRIGIGANVDCYSRLVFEGNDGKNYAAKLELGLNRNNNYKEPVWTLEVDGTTITKEVDRNIHAAVGLSFEQFCRMAMLAQGQFAEFLTGNRDERAKVLEQITNTERFTTYGKTISELKKNYCSEAESAKKVYEEISKGVLSDDDKCALEKSLSEKNEEQANLQKELGAITKQLEWINAVLAAEENIKQLRVAEQKLNEQAESEEYKAGVTLVSDFDRTHDQRSWLAKRDQDSARLKGEEAKIPGLQQEYNTLASDLQARVVDLATLETNIKNQRLWLSERSGNDQLYTNAGAIVEKIKALDGERKRLGENQRKLTAEQSNTAALNDAAAKAKDELNAASASVEAKQREIVEATKKRDELDVNAIRDNLQKANDRKQSLRVLHVDDEQLSQTLKSKKEVDEEIEKGERKLAECKKALTETQNGSAEAESNRRLAESRLTAMESGTQEAMNNLRQQLQETHAEICPLCGQSIKDLHFDIDGILSPLREEYNRCQEAESRAKEVYNEALSRHSAVDGKLQGLQNRQKELADVISELQPRVSGGAAAMDLDITQPLALQIDSELQKVEQAISTLTEKQRQAIAMQMALDKLLNEHGQLEAKRVKAERSEVEARNNLQNNAGAIERLRGDVASCESSVQQRQQELDRCLDTYKSDWAADTDATTQQLQKEANEYLDNKRSCEAAQENLKRQRELVCTLQSNQTQVLGLHPEWAHEAQPVLLNTNNPQGMWTNLFANTKSNNDTINNLTAQIAEATGNLDEYYRTTGNDEQALRSIAERAGQIEGIRSEINTHNGAVAEVNGRLKGEKCRRDEAMSMLKITVVSQLPDKQTQESRKKDLEAKQAENAVIIGREEERLRKDRELQTAVADREKECEAARNKAELWEKIDKLFGGNKFRNMVQTQILKPLLASANIYLREITDRYTLTCSSENEQLSILVLDNYNKGRVRSATVLSGGERFMVSLALSLALSSLNIKGKGVNILFIDEGFGTLDTNSLNSVMETLNMLPTLSNQHGRRVGIISHREDLEERIPVKIHVYKKAGQTGSSVSIEGV